MGWLDFFKKKAPRFTPVNALEEMIAAGKLETDPRAFFETFMTRQIYVVGPVSEKTGSFVAEAGDSLRILTQDVDGRRLAYAYTSEDALRFAAQGTERGFIRLSGREVLEMLLHAKLTMNLNGGLGPPILVGPEQIEFIFRTLSQKSADVQEVVRPAGTSISMTVPDASERLLRSISEFLKNHPAFTEVGLARAAMGEEPPMLLAVLFQEGKPAGDEEALQRLHTLIQDVGGHDLTLGQPVNFVFRGREFLAEFPGIIIGRDGHRLPPG